MRATRRIGRAMGLAVMVVGVLGSGAWGQPRPAEPLPPLKAVVTVAPLKGLLEPLLPLGSEVKVLMTPGRSEHGYEFTPEDLAALTSADVVVRVGLGLEPKVAEVLRRQPRATREEVCFARVVGLEPQATEAAGTSGGEPAPGPTPAGHEGHDHAAHEDHDHEAHGPDPHLWLDPALCADLVPVMAIAVTRALEHKAPLTDLQREELVRVEALQIVKVTNVDEAWRARLAAVKGRAMVTHHDAFSRPAARYGFRIAAVIRGSESAEPGPGDVASIVASIRREGVRTIFVEPQFNKDAAERIARAAKVRTATLDPLGDGDWFALMQKNLDALVRGLGDTP